MPLGARLHMYQTNYPVLTREHIVSLDPSKSKLLGNPGILVIDQERLLIRAQDDSTL